ncbi:hypothetical protein BaRGS_00001911 [Batillaria attramentaria]|uniref:Flavin-containing monooxygenase n=1 Tax=Batillaria attramentaria TaxID=370345 RepID=A0ABD0M6C7_9CAEN
MSKRVAVIGGGCSGLAAIKCCVDERLEPVCFERTDEVGGLWHYTDNVRNGQACVMRSTVINTSKEMTCFSDYPIPKELPSYMHNLRCYSISRTTLSISSCTITSSTKHRHVIPVSDCM